MPDNEIYCPECKTQRFEDLHQESTDLSRMYNEGIITFAFNCNNCETKFYTQFELKCLTVLQNDVPIF